MPTQFRFLAGPLMDIVPKTLLRCLGCGIRVTVMLEGEPLARSGLLSTLDTSILESKSLYLLHAAIPQP